MSDLTRRGFMGAAASLTGLCGADETGFAFARGYREIKQAVRDSARRVPYGSVTPAGGPSP